MGRGDVTGGKIRLELAGMLVNDVPGMEADR